MSRHAALHSPRADLTLATALSSVLATIVAVELPCYDLEDTKNFWACTPPVWRSAEFILLAACDAAAVACLSKPRPTESQAHADRIPSLPRNQTRPHGASA